MAEVERHDGFQGSPWGAEPTDDWNRPAYWRDYHAGLTAKADSWRRGRVVHREVDLLIQMPARAGELPRRSPRTLLDAGCGIALIPHLLASWGGRVIAVDSCPEALEVASHQRPSEEEPARRVPIWDACADWPGARELVEDPVRSLRRLREFQAPGGVLLLENLNAIGVQDEVVALLAECGFVPFAPGGSREAAGKDG